ncbi:hypothetical protein COU91_01515 [Candidatus Saccharibacteria bacterium CG10_big_fil_rev_8_21_14_0_10_47_8]|nr:MAG: hypothetical protein COU91_01515 [Candidatus Saccharibacteria bacterium CG10_big_fil_rev_8_21_14_0_10_47_8]
MSTIFLILAIVFGVVMLMSVGILSRRMTHKLNQDYFQKKWLELLARVKTSDGIVLAVIDADKLLDEALKRRNFNGKTMGERLVAAQRSLTDNDSVWYAHKLRNRLVHEPDTKLKKREAQNALAGFRRGLKDLGAL